MPLPKPKTDESQDDFMDRCMANDVMNSEYPDNDQRYAVCQSLWDDSRQKPENGKLEKRVAVGDALELRIEGDKDKKRLVGYAARFNKWSEDLGFFRERIAPGAFTEALQTSDVRALKNHDQNLLLGRTEAGTLRLEENARGLRFDLDVPKTTTGQDVLEEVRRGDITGCSFAFTVASDQWFYPDEDSNEPVQRTILKVDRLFDVGPVTYPAYPDTTVAARMLDMHKQEKREDHQVSESEVAGEVEEPKDTAPEELDFETRHRIKLGYREAGRIIARNTMRIEELKNSE